MNAKVRIVSDPAYVHSPRIGKTGTIIAVIVRIDIDEDTFEDVELLPDFVELLDEQEAAPEPRKEQS
jgi:hypothetical protein